MRERPIIFSGESVRAILAGIKVQTRRVVKPQPPHRKWEVPRWIEYCPHGSPGDRLWVREKWAPTTDQWIIYAADSEMRSIASGEVRGHVYQGPWRSPIHMPRRFARIWLEITDVRVERVQEITEEDAQAEGIECATMDFNSGDRVAGHRRRFQLTWDSLNAQKGFSWNTNCWVWVLTFRRV